MRINRFFVFAVLFGSLSSGLGLAQPAGVEGLKVFRGARIIDGTGRAPLQQGTIVIRNRRIEAVGAPAVVKIPAGATRIDLSARRSCRASSTPMHT